MKFVIILNLLAIVSAFTASAISHRSMRKMNKFNNTQQKSVNQAELLNRFMRKMSSNKFLFRMRH